MIDHGQHESLGWREFGRLPYWSRRRARRQLAEFLAKAKVTADVQLRWVRTAPSNLRSLAEQLGAEADRLFGLDDPIAPVFEAWSESARLADQVWKMERENTDRLRDLRHRTAGSSQRNHGNNGLRNGFQPPEE